MTNQEIFDTVIAHLRRQGGPAMAPSPTVPDLMTCRYKTPDGFKCAVGCLIPDDAYTVALEGACATDQCVLDALPFNATTSNEALLLDLQEVHDHQDPNTWEAEFVKLAQAHKLVYPLP